MSDPWKLLEDAGVPHGAPRPLGGSPLDVPLLAVAAQQAIQDGLTQRERDALVGWLLALRSHWPSAFAQLAGAVEKLDLAAIDPGRALKLRRIALANLAGRL